MKNIGVNDSIFDFDCKHTLAFSYYGGEVNNQHAFHNYMIGYKASADATFDAFKKAVISGDNEVVDTICYPLVYLYRHVVELMLKYSYIELKKYRTDNDIETLLNKGHHLKELWNQVKPDFERLSKRTGVAVDVLAIEHYIMELSIVDDSSMAYRYPIKKNLNRYHDQDLRLNIPRLKERMDAFYNYMYAVIYQLSSHLEDYNYSFEFDEHFTNAIKKSLANIGVALNRISVNIEKYAHDNDIEHEMDEIFNGNTDIYDWADSFSELEKSVLLLLYYTGEKIQWSTLSIDATERRKDVICIAYDFAQGLKWLALDAAKSDTKDDLFMKHITNGGRMSKKYIELTLSELGISFQEA